jgi:cell division protease FtsH
VIFNKISTGALSDLEKVTKQAMAMVTIYGLDEKIGNVSYYDSQNQGYGFTKPYSEETAKIIDQEIKKIIDSQYKRAQAILKKHEDKLHQLANKLLETEVIFKEDLEVIFGKRPFEKEEIDKKDLKSESKEDIEDAEIVKKEESSKKSA